MEQQTISIAKGGLICNLNTRVAILASANPVGSRYNRQLTVLENIRLPSTLLSRFDLVYLMLDKCNVSYDKELARHLVSLFWEQTPPDLEKKLDLNTLRDYIGYSKATCFPIISDHASFVLVKGYLYCRENNSMQCFTTPRYLESLIRISEALARMNLNKVISREHAYEALRLRDSALYEAVLNVERGVAENEKSINDDEILPSLIEEILIQSPTKLFASEELWEILESRLKSVITWSLFNKAIETLKNNNKVRQNHNIILLPRDI
jgi:DNA replication licensing factor MCM4